jgi:hypothetical protein
MRNEINLESYTGYLHIGVDYREQTKKGTVIRSLCLVPSPVLLVLLEKLFTNEESVSTERKLFAGDLQSSADGKQSGEQNDWKVGAEK